MEYAILKSGGKQYKVMAGDTIFVEKVKGEANDAFTFSEVLLHVQEGKVRIGNPLVSGLTIAGTIVAQTQGTKVRVAKFKAKSRYRKVTGHRKKLTKITINAIGNQEPVKESKSEENTEKKPVTRTKSARTSKK